MDLARIKEWWGYPDRKGNFNPRVADRVDWLIAEVERLNTENATLKRHWVEDDRDLNALIAENEQLKASLTLSRAEGKREGMEEAARIAENMPVPGFASDHKHDGYEQATEDIAAAIREAAQPKEGRE